VEPAVHSLLPLVMSWKAEAYVVALAASVYSVELTTPWPVEFCF
jgi:hypothetical protein